MEDLFLTAFLYVPRKNWVGVSCQSSNLPFLVYAVCLPHFRGSFEFGISSTLCVQSCNSNYTFAKVDVNFYNSYKLEHEGKNQK